MTEAQTEELSDIADELAQIPDALAESVLERLMAFILENGK